MGSRRNLIDLSGQRFGRLLVVKRSGYHRTTGEALWVCRCDCGGEATFRSWVLRQGRATKCKGSAHFLARDHRLTHRSWESMLNRCRKTSGRHWKYYGSCGVTVCDRWSDFANFLADMGDRPSRRHTIDRIDPNGNYEPGNCRWATVSEQNCNRRNTLYIEVDGARVKLVDYCQKVGVSAQAVRTRLRLGWTLERACSEPVRKYR